MNGIQSEYTEPRNRRVDRNELERARLVIKGLVFIVGGWLLVAAFIMSDIRGSLFFMGILLIIYAMVAMLIYHKVCRAKAPEKHKPSQCSSEIAWARSEQSEQGIRVTMFKRPHGMSY